MEHQCAEEEQKQKESDYEQLGQLNRKEKIEQRVESEVEKMHEVCLCVSVVEEQKCFD